jgi:hypothetical protein
MTGDKANMMGVGTTPELATPTAMLGEMAIRAINRLSRGKKPWCLTLSFNSPHPPVIATKSYAKFYNKKRNNLFVSDSIGDDMTGNAYEKEALQDEGYGDRDKVKAWTAVYYALIEEDKLRLFLTHATSDTRYFCC